MSITDKVYLHKVASAVEIWMAYSKANSRLIETPFERVDVKA
jgi:hypothetical protein